MEKGICHLTVAASACALTGSRTDMGTAYGKMLAPTLRGVYNTFVEKIIPKESERALMELFVDWQWDTYLSQQTPAEYLEEVLSLSPSLSL